MVNINKNGRKAALDEVLVRLGEPKAYGGVTAEGGLAVFVARNHFARPVQTVGPDVFALLMSGELIAVAADRPEAWVISRLGRARLRRASAADSPFRSQHQALDLREARAANGDAIMVRVNHAESPLGWLVSHKDRTGKPLINQEQFAAGERMRRDFTLANLPPRVTALWGTPANHAGRNGGSDSASMNDTMIAAKDRLWAAFDAVGPDLGGVLLQVCCHLNGLAGAERQLGWPARSGKVVLGIALDRLAVHYGISQAAGTPKKRARIEQSAPVHKDTKNNLHNTQNNSCKS